MDITNDNDDNDNNDDNEFNFEFDNIYIDVDENQEEEQIFELSDDTTTLCETKNNIIKYELSQNDKILINQLEFLIDNQYLPGYLYPVDNLITNEYIKKISEYLYKIFIHRKLYGYQNKKNSYRTYKSSPLRISHKPDDNNQLSCSLDDLMNSLKEELEYMEDISNNFLKNREEVV